MRPGLFFFGLGHVTNSSCCLLIFLLTSIPSCQAQQFFPTEDMNEQQIFPFENAGE